MLHLSPIQSAEAASIASPKLLFHFAAGEFRRDQLEFGAGERQGTAGQAATQAELNRYQFHGSDTTWTLVRGWLPGVPRGGGNIENWNNMFMKLWKMVENCGELPIPTQSLTCAFENG